ncbi:MAG: alpha-galactosidase [Chitinophagaceae bacterium]
MKTILKYLLLLFTIVPVATRAQIIPILTRNNVLVLEVDTSKRVGITYFGQKLNNPDEYRRVSDLYRQGDDYTGILNSAYTPGGSLNLFEPAISVIHGDGNTSLDLEYVSHTTTEEKGNVSLTTVILKDKLYPFQVKLFYKTYFAQDVVEMWSSISHTEKKPVVLSKFASGNLYIKAPEFWLRNYHGDWAREMQPEETKLTHGIKTLDSKLGTRANLFQPPLFMVSMGKAATEDEGSVLLGSVSWTGNFRIDLELDNRNNLRLLAGINNFQSAYTLKTGEQFETPKFLYTLSSAGKGLASRNLHDWARNYGMVDGHGSRMTLLNNWEATEFNFDEKILAGLLKDTKKLGVDLFLLDDGWFANKYPRNGDRAGLGDWEENRKKLPNGISYLVKEAAANDVKFGIWLEPEMVNPKSELYEKHPEWVIRQPGRAEYYFRNQLVLDLTNPAVQNFVFGVVDDLLTKNPSLAYIKWDCNAVIYNAQSAFLTNQSHLYIEYVRGLYRVLERIRAKYPSIPLMLCSGGGGRVDYGALQYFTEYWPSDNTDPLERIFMQWEYSYFFPAIASSNHVTDWGKQSLKYRIDVAMMGKMGFDIVIAKLPPDELAFSQQSVRVYDSIKNLVWHGAQYRLSDPWKDAVASVVYVDSLKTSAVLFNYLVNNRYGQGSAFPVRLKGLDPMSVYRIREVNLFPGTKSPVDSSVTCTGDFLMKVGFNPLVRSGRNSVVLVLEKVK